ncbi:hypothetical protein [Halorientalis regularis]|uniref:Uncharacterized protein n=1 Tax=Halorientalis regularis TaxID=660518 RepID=A0A1G7TUF6_9EURY|nr:hypothetical protein [Halorientalis regularis]SDG38872.1 hypothetical protein SAMN05216218_13011 [Halorientalis regularis]
MFSLERTRPSHVVKSVLSSSRTDTGGGEDAISGDAAKVRPHQHLAPAIDERIESLTGSRPDPLHDPLAQLEPLCVPNLRDEDAIERLIDAWLVEMTARDDVVIQYTSPEANANLVLQYLDITLFSDEVPPGTQYVRFSTLASGHGSWSRRQLHRHELVQELTDRLTSRTPMNTTRIGFDGTVDWIRIGTRDELGSPITDDPDPQA